ncbi:MAG: HhH-GPD base excision DNA repair family protein; Probable 3-methyladenine DNA glycosylase/8-oxoguanine DNA glycosylase [uncultured Microvirga sp.]|uniref:DNA-3-methyladenine glycosylase II n=1 Tax=uncultured Microvirga sp. TaxID=412392 RepID=A0A6J4KJ40_9HYPH|nr:MAG: HhH-GPD base excision DNA repair family protein; Probable 3-methyladenine DNA glycosylase/8-oxoguanine DNA glycosylase [uncultured Microvirga sp.]
MTLILDSDAVLQQGLAALSALDPVMERIIAAGAVPTLRKRDPGFEGLAGIIVSQQLSTASAKAIWARVGQKFPQPTPKALLAASEEELRACGLSGPKIRTLRAIGEAVVSGALPLDRLDAMTADEAHAVMTAVKGIGPWTADIYLLFCLGHPDAFPAGDLAVQEAARIAYGLDARPKDKALVAFAERWRPWRGVAAKVLWAYYSATKAREGAPVAS